MPELFCISCGCRFSIQIPRWRCTCGGLIDLDFQPSLNTESLKQQAASMWRYADALPLPSDVALSLGEGFTPMIPVKIGGREILVKQEQLSPTGSYKDRGAALMISVAAQLGIRRVVEDSSGNAGSAVAAYCAKANIECDIYVPADTPAGKIGQMTLYGAQLHRVQGSREKSAEVCMKAAEHIFYASHVYNPFFLHGTKTFAYEIVEQLGWQKPDTLVLPAGNGTLLLGAFIGFKELCHLGIIDSMPKLIAVQAANCAPLYQAFIWGEDTVQDVSAKATLAKGIAIARPPRASQMLAAVRDSGGMFLAQSEEDIIMALQDMGRKGFCIEPTSAAVIAGAASYVSGLKQDEQIVTVFSGHGLKVGEKLHSLAGLSTSQL